MTQRESKSIDRSGLNTSAKSATRRLEILRACAAEMRREGVLNARLQDIAERVGVSYTALYHYFRSRDQLTAEVLLMTLENRRAMLVSAQGSTALEVLMDFVKRDLLSDREHKVQLPPMFGLGAEFRAKVATFRNGLIDNLVELVDRGVQEGSIRCGDSQALAMLILVLLDAFAVLDDQIMTRAVSTDMKDVVTQVTGALEQGLLADRTTRLEPSFVIPQGDMLLGTPWGLNPGFDRLERLLQAASRAFNQEGAAASIPRIAASLGMSKTIFYQYFTDKHELLYQTYLRGVRVIETSHQIAGVVGQHSLDEVLIHRANLYRFHDSVAGPFTMLNAIEFLRPEQQRVVRARNHGTRHASEQRLGRAIEQGFLRRDLDPAIIQPMLGRTVYWQSVQAGAGQTRGEHLKELLYRGLVPL